MKYNVMMFSHEYQLVKTVEGEIGLITLYFENHTEHLKTPCRKMLLTGMLKH